MRMYAMGSGEDAPAMPQEATLVLNANSSLIRRLGEKAESGAEDAEKTAKQVYTLALLAQRQLTAEELRSFLSDSFGMLEKQMS